MSRRSRKVIKIPGQRQPNGKLIARLFTELTLEFVKSDVNAKEYVTRISKVFNLEERERY